MARWYSRTSNPMGGGKSASGRFDSYPLRQHRRERRHQPGREDAAIEPDLRHADSGGGPGEARVLRQAPDEARLLGRG